MRVKSYIRLSTSLLGIGLMTWGGPALQAQFMQGFSLGTDVRQSLRGSNPGTESVASPVQAGTLPAIGAIENRPNSGRPDSPLVNDLPTNSNQSSDPFSQTPSDRVSILPATSPNTASGDPFNTNTPPGSSPTSSLEPVAGGSDPFNGPPAPSSEALTAAAGEDPFSTDPGTNPAAGQPTDGLGAKVVAYAKSKFGQQVGNGECWTLAYNALLVSGADIDQTGEYIFGTKVTDDNAAKPGDIVQFENVTFEHRTPTSIETSTMAHHTAVVSEVVSPGVYRLLHQNVNGSKVVQNGEINLSERKPGGSLIFYRPRPAPRVYNLEPY